MLSPDPSRSSPDSSRAAHDVAIDAQIELPQNIRPIREYLGRKGAQLREEAGIYAFWWIGDKAMLMGSNRRMILKGPGERPVEVEYRDWWPEHLTFPCLYVGKSTNIKKRFSLHLKTGCPGRLHVAHPEMHKAKPVTTSCQLRFGIEHIFPMEQDPLSLIRDCVGFSYRTNFSDNAIVERFYEEDRLVGTWRPWFNIDSER